MKEKFYIFGGDGLVAVQITDNTGSRLSYVHKDHLGSIQCFTDESGLLTQELSFDSWGNRRNPETWAVYATAPSDLILDRGFTGHEHIDLFDLVNMDGRVYDPVIGRFLSPDPIIQDLENLQCLNRYSYCLNNPLSLVDPSGYSWFSQNWRSLVTAGIAISVSMLTAGIGSGVGAAMIAGSMGGFAGGFVGTLLNDGNMAQAFKAGVIGGLIGGASGFLNFAAGYTELSGIGAVIEKTAKHVFGEAWMCTMQGNNVLHGMINGGLTSIGNGFINSGSTSDFLKVVSSAVLGGTVSEIGGGKFANGAITGAYGMLFNEMLHEDVLSKRENLARSAELSRKNKDPYKYCNVFAQDKMVENEMNPTDDPLSAGVWGDPSIEKKGWRILGSNEKPNRGDMGAAKHSFSNGATGHMGIMVSANEMIYAGGQNPYVVKSKMEFMPKFNWIYYRYIGK